MVELQHRNTPTPKLTGFLASHPNPTPGDFDSPEFSSVKKAIKADLHADQQGLCVYCEKKLKHTEGQVEHIKPKSKAPHLCFEYHNYAHSCTNSKTCGQKKKDGELPIEPGPGCNSRWTLSTDGTIEPIAGLTRAERHKVTQTRDMLGLNKDAYLVDERRRWLKNTLTVLQSNPNDIELFLQNIPYRHIMATAL